MDAVPERQVLIGVRAARCRSRRRSRTRLRRGWPTRTTSAADRPCGSACRRVSTSRVAVRRMYGSGVCHRMISRTMLRIRSGLAINLSYCSGNWLSPYTLPDIVFRVVSLPPTINRSRLPRCCIGGHVLGGLAVHQHRHQVVARVLPALLPQPCEVVDALDATRRAAARATRRCRPARGSRTRRRTSGSACGDPRTGSRTGSPASAVVSSIETMSTQSNVSPSGSDSSTSTVRSRISGSTFLRLLRLHRRRDRATLFAVLGRVHRDERHDAASPRGGSWLDSAGRA